MPRLCRPGKGAEVEKERERNLEAELIQSFAQWDRLREYGGSDPFYDDATNLNLLRNHIIYWKMEMKSKYGEDEGKYPKIYFRETPDVAEHGFVVKAAEIRDKAVEALNIYLEDDNFRYLLYKRELLNKKEAEKISIDNVLGYVSTLAEALKKDDLITMRRHAFRPDNYQQSFAECVKRVNEILAKRGTEEALVKSDGQMTLFQFGLDVGQCR